MNWLEEWAKFEVICKWIGISIAALMALLLLGWIVFYAIRWKYREHSKKYVWDCTKHAYVKKEDFYKDLNITEGE